MNRWERFLCDIDPGFPARCERLKAHEVDMRGWSVIGAYRWWWRLLDVPYVVRAEMVLLLTMQPWPMALRGGLRDGFTYLVNGHPLGAHFSEQEAAGPAEECPPGVPYSDWIAYRQITRPTLLAYLPVPPVGEVEP